jgi:hypothetical protein
MVLRDNYFGSFTNFSTLFEYLDKRRRNIPVGDPIHLKYREGKVSVSVSLWGWIFIVAQNNMFHCTLSFLINGAAFVLPAGLLSVEAPQANGISGTGPCVVLSIPEQQLHLRLHDFFLGEFFVHVLRFES